MLIEPTLLFSSDKEDKAINYCNGCKNLIYAEIPGQHCYNCRCKGSSGTNGSDRILKLKAYLSEKIQKPFWCPIGIKNVRQSLGLPAVQPKTSALSEKQQLDWEKSRKLESIRKKWCAAPGITAWSDIMVGKKYHIPPSLKHNRMDIKIFTKYPSSIYARNIKTNDNVWIFKEEEDFKYLSEIK